MKSLDLLPVVPFLCITPSEDAQDTSMLLVPATPACALWLSFPLYPSPLPIFSARLTPVPRSCLFALQ